MNSHKGRSEPKIIIYMFYDLKAVRNPFDKEFTVICPSPTTNAGEEYTIEPKGLLLLPELIAKNVAIQIAREVLKEAGKEFDDPSRLKIEEDLLTDEFEIKDLSKGIITQEKPLKKGGK